MPEKTFHLVEHQDSGLAAKYCFPFASVNDCAIRAISIALGKNYNEVKKELQETLYKLAYDDPLTPQPLKKIWQNTYTLAKKCPTYTFYTPTIIIEMLDKYGWDFMLYDNEINREIYIKDLPTDKDMLVATHDHLTYISDGGMHDNHGNYWLAKLCRKNIVAIFMPKREHSYIKKYLNLIPKKNSAKRIRANKRLLKAMSRMDC